MKADVAAAAAALTDFLYFCLLGSFKDNEHQLPSALRTTERTGYGILVTESWLQNPGRGILWVARWMSNISELKSW